MEIIKGLDAIREAQTMEHLNMHQIYLELPQYSKGYVMTLYSFDLQNWLVTWYESEENAIDMYKKLTSEFGAYRFGDCVLYRCRGQRDICNHPFWTKYAMVIE